MPGKPTLRDLHDPRYDYAERMSGPVPDYLVYVERQTHLKTVAPQMMSGRLQGRVLSMLSALLQPTRILEIGTFTGYATLCLAEGLAGGGTIDTVEGDPETAALARHHFGRSPHADCIELHVGQALQLFATERLDGPYDLIFLDADKAAYPSYFGPAVERLRPGGLLIADNVLWDGKVGTGRRDRVVNGLEHYNRLVTEHGALSCVLLPLRDGLSVARMRQ